MPLASPLRVRAVVILTPQLHVPSQLRATPQPVHHIIRPQEPLLIMRAARPVQLHRQFDHAGSIAG
jgi:hypothetical protein